jgi:hypothetical protein
VKIALEAAGNEIDNSNFWWFFMSQSVSEHHLMEWAILDEPTFIVVFSMDFVLLG